MKKKKTILKYLLLIIGAIVVLYFVVKAIIIMNFNNKFNLLGDVPIEEKNINTINLEENEYYNFNSIKLRNVFENYITYNKSQTGVGLSSNDERKIFISSSVVDIVDYYTSEQINNFKKSGLENSIDLYEKFKNKERVNLFSFRDNLLDSINLYNSLDVSDYFNDHSKVKEVEFGMIDGNNYILYIQDNNFTAISIYKNNKIEYSISFVNFEKSDVYNLINTIKLD